jgi:hypothetical protein
VKPHRASAPGPQRAGPLVTLSPTDVFSLDGARQALGLGPTSLKREVRQGRLKVSKRCGRYFVTGAQLLAWLAACELPRRRAVEVNGHAGDRP